MDEAPSMVASGEGKRRRCSGRWPRGEMMRQMDIPARRAMNVQAKIPLRPSLRIFQRGFLELLWSRRISFSAAAAADQPGRNEEDMVVTEN